MRKNIDFDSTICETRNSLSDALKRKDNVIIIKGNAYDEFKKEAEKRYKSGGMKKTTFGSAGIAAMSLLPGAGAIFAILGGALFITKALNVAVNDFKNYRYTFHEINNAPCMILIRDSKTATTFSAKYDTIKGFDNIKFAESCKCVSCGTKLDKKKYNNFEICKCEKCGANNLQLYKR